MEENSYATLLQEQSEELRKTFSNSIPICLSNANCHSCPFYDKKMVNEAGTHCFSSLMAYYSRKLLQMAYDIEEKEKENHAEENKTLLQS